MNKTNINILLPIITLIVGGLIGYMVWGQADTQHGHVESEINSDATSEDIWTCSMHPQIRLNEPGICPICEMDLIPLDNNLESGDPTVLQMSVEAAKLAQIETFKIGSNLLFDSNASDGKSKIEVDGTVELDERTVKSQTAHLSGRIESMAVTFEGQYVNAGQKIARVYSTELLAASQELLTASQYNDKVEGLKDAAIQKLKNWKVTDRQIEQILSSGLTIETIDIYADHSGYVLSKKISQGDYVKQGQSMYTLGSTRSVWLIFNVFESDIASVKKGDEIKFTTSTVAGKEFSAKVTYINPLLNSQSRTATVRAEMSNVNNQLRPGMLLNGQIVLSKISNNSKRDMDIMVPNSAILWTGDQSVVYVQLPDSEVPSYQFREVKVLKRSANFSTISEGLEDGEAVVVHGAFAIDASAQLNNNISMMNRKVTIKKDVQSDIVPSFIDDTPQVFKMQLESVVSSYINLKNALVDTDSNSAGFSAEELLKSLDGVDMNLVKGDAHGFWMDQMRAIEQHGSRILKSKDVEEQRHEFDFLSQSVINVLKAFGTNEKTYYLQHCPMVKNNIGADWISTDSVIKNPYFGDKMMKCGSVKLELN